MKTRYANAAMYAVLGIFAFVSFFPLFYMFTNSFMGAFEYNKFYGGLEYGLSGRNPFHIIPEMITLDGYKEILISRPHYLVKFWNSLFLSGTIVAGQIVIAVLGGYAFSRFRFLGRDVIFFVIILIMMLPYQVTLVPNFIVLDAMGLIGSYAAVILPGIFSAFGVFLVRQVMAGIPTSILEAARIDGAGSWRILWQIMLPNCKSVVAALMILSFADNWNMVEQPIVYLRDAGKMPLSVFLTSVYSIRPEVGFACGMLSIVPALLLFLHFKDEMIQGIEYSAVK